MTNELTNVNMETGEIVETSDQVVQDTSDYTIVKKENGKFEKQMKFKEYMSRVPETDEEKIELYKVFNDSDSNLVKRLSYEVGNTINIKDVFIRPYESFDEGSGNVIQGVLTTLQDTDGQYYATSSKSVYYSLKNIFQAFGSPDMENYKPVQVEVTETKQQNGMQINIRLVGLA